MIHFDLRGYQGLIDANRKTVQRKLKVSRQAVSLMVGTDLPGSIQRFLDVLNALGIDDVSQFFIKTDGKGRSRTSRPRQAPHQARRVDLVESGRKR